MKTSFAMKSLIAARLAICLSGVVLTLRPGFAQDSLPDGWRKPTAVEAKGVWRNKSAVRFLVVKGDFDGDGRDDLAELLVNDSGREFALFVRLSSQHDAWQSIHGGRAPLGDFGIRRVRPGKRDTLCGDDPSVCAPDTAKSLDLANSAIEFFTYGEASSIFYWDKTAKRFRATDGRLAFDE
jgi:hypothetical protein